MVAQGAMTGVDDVFGLHIWSQMPVGTASCRVGSSFASADIFSVDFKGRGGHGAMPNACIDAAVIASSFVMNLQTIVSRGDRSFRSSSCHDWTDGCGDPF